MGSAPRCYFSQNAGLSAWVAEELQILHLSNLGGCLAGLRCVSAPLSTSAGEKGQKLFLFV